MNVVIVCMGAEESLEGVLVKICYNIVKITYTRIAVIIIMNMLILEKIPPLWIRKNLMLVDWESRCISQRENETCGKGETHKPEIY